MDLKKRLASLDRLTRKPAVEKSAAEATAVRPAGPELAAAQGERLGALGLHPLDPEAGTDSSQVYVADYADPVPCPADTLPALAGFFARGGDEATAARQVLFLDTETTGLMGGTGTLAFLVGVSWWQPGDTLRTRQFFLPSPAAEPRLLKTLAELAQPFAVVATYNGAAFDLPLLRTRALLNRLDDPLAGLAGWDLLVPGRRLWNRQLPDCRQQTVEARVCGLQRGEQDIPGQLIPQTWFTFLQQGHTEDLARVLYHNRRDMVGMAHIFARLVAAAHDLEAGPRSAPAIPGDAARAWHRAWSLGRIAEYRGQGDVAGLWLAEAVQQAVGLGAAGFTQERFVADALRVIKRTADWNTVENIIARALHCGQNGAWLHREAAILYEHRLIRLEKALHHARQAGEEHRIRRLENKLAGRGPVIPS